MAGRFDRILIFSPEGVTGGVESLHQLAYLLSDAGIDAQIVYTGPYSKCRIGDGVVGCELHPQSPAYRAYQQYAPRVAERVVVSERSFLMFPEYHVELAWQSWRAVGADVGCWWLGVPTGAAILNRHEWRSTFLSEVRQFHQSHYAMEFLKGVGSSSVPLFDYISDEWRSAILHKRPNTIAFFPTKGGDLALAFFERLRAVAPEIEPIPIAGMSKPQVMRALGMSQAYIDFGHQPGKDRVPREAAAAGAVVLLHRQGAGVSYEDSPLDENYKFDRADIASGALAATVQGVLANLPGHLVRQGTYRQRIADARGEVEAQIRDFFL